MTRLVVSLFVRIQMLRTKLALALTLATASILAFGCNVESGDGVSVSTSAITEAGLTEFLNDYTVSTLPVLDFNCAIRSDSARYIDNYRRGPDLIYGTADDRTIDSEAELDSIYMVGPWTITQLYACAESFGYEGNSCDPDDVWTEIVDDLPSGIGDYDDLGDVCNYPNLIGNAHFADTEVTYSGCGDVLSYKVTWWQTIDEEVNLYRTEKYDAELDLVDSYCDV